MIEITSEPDTGVYHETRTFDLSQMRRDFIRRFVASGGYEPSFGTTVHYVEVYKDELMKNGFTERAA